MEYRFEVLPVALRQLEKMDKTTQVVILRKLKWIAAQSNPIQFSRKLHRSKIGDIRFRIGDYRVIAVVHGSIIGIFKIAHRREAYREN